MELLILEKNEKRKNIRNWWFVKKQEKMRNKERKKS